MPRIDADLSGVTDEDMNHEGGWTALADGEYRFVVDSSDYKPTNKGDGARIGLELICVEPGHEKRKLYDYLTIDHPSDDVVRIAKARLKQLAIAVGHPRPDYVEDTLELHDVPVVVRLVCVPADNPKYGDRNGNQNRIVGYFLPKAQQAAQPEPLRSTVADAVAATPPGGDAPLITDDIPF